VGNGTKTPERLVWAVESLELKPTDHVLEIGCGSGVAASLVCDRLTRGKLLAIDRSAVAVSAARKRNRAHVRAARAEFRTVAIEKVDLGARRFHKIFAFNVGALRRDLASELARLTRALRPKGTLRLFEQPPLDALTASVADGLVRALQEQGLVVRDVIFKELKPAPVVCVIASKGDPIVPI